MTGGNEEYMGFILDGLETEDYDRHYGDRELLGRIWDYFRPYGRQMALVALMITLNSAAGTAAPILIARSIDLIAANPTTSAIFMLGGGVALIGASGWLFNFIRQYFSARIVGNVVLKLREDVFAATIGHDLSFYDDHPSGKVVSRVTSDTQDFATVVDLTLSLFSQVLLVVILSGLAVQHQRLADPDPDRDDPAGGVAGAQLSLPGPPRDPGCAPRDGDDQRADPGVGERDHRRQELPAGRGDLRDI
jgi:ABC-type bacteriocin/lantibiotic exporter with double-glycine peptidase domain